MIKYFIIPLSIIIMSCSFRQKAPLNCSINRVDKEVVGIMDTLPASISGTIYKDKSHYVLNFKDYKISLNAHGQEYPLIWMDEYRLDTLWLAPENYELRIINPKNNILITSDTIKIKSGEILKLKISMTCP